MMLSRRLMVLVWEDRMVELHIPTLPTPCCSVAGSGVLDCMDDSPQHIHELQLCHRMMAASRCRGTEDGVDGAFSNICYQNYVRLRAMNSLASSVPSEGGARGWIHCGSHKNRLGENDTKSAVDSEDALGKLTSFICMLRSAGHFLRLLAALFVTIDAKLEVVIGAPPPGSNLLLQYWRDHQLFYAYRFKNATRSTTDNPLGGCVFMIGCVFMTVERHLLAPQGDVAGECGIVAPKANLCIQSRSNDTVVLPKVTSQESVES